VLQNPIFHSITTVHTCTQSNVGYGKIKLVLGTAWAQPFFYQKGAKGVEECTKSPSGGWGEGRPQTVLAHFKPGLVKT